MEIAATVVLCTGITGECECREDGPGVIFPIRYIWSFHPDRMPGMSYKAPRGPAPWMLWVRRHKVLAALGGIAFLVLITVAAQASTTKGTPSPGATSTAVISATRAAAQPSPSQTPSSQTPSSQTPSPSPATAAPSTIKATVAAPVPATRAAVPPPPPPPPATTAPPAAPSRLPPTQQFGNMLRARRILPELRPRGEWRGGRRQIHHMREQRRMALGTRLTRAGALPGGPPRTPGHNRIP